MSNLEIRWYVKSDNTLKELHGQMEGNSFVVNERFKLYYAGNRLYKDYEKAKLRLRKQIEKDIKDREQQIEWDKTRLQNNMNYLQQLLKLKSEYSI